MQNLNDAVAELVDGTMIADARNAHAAAAEKVTQAEAAVADAQTAKRNAVRAAEKAAAGGDAGAVETAELALEQADRSLRVAIRLRDAAVNAKNAAYKNIGEVEAKAHRGVAKAGILGRMTAVRKADAATQMLKEAVAEWEFSNLLIGRARSAGVGMSPEISNRNLIGDNGRYDYSEEKERRLLSGHQVDPDSGMHSSWG